MSRQYSTIFLLLLISVLSFYNQLQADPADQMVKQLMQQYHLPGAAIAVMRNGKLIKARGYGWANKAKHTKASPHQLFRIASVSKILTGVSTLQLIQAGKLHYQSNAFSVLKIKALSPKYRNKASEKITVRNLLLMAGGWGNSHDTGIDLNFGPLPWIATHNFHLKAPLTCEETARLAQNVTLDYPPGTTFAYANPNYCLLGLLISKVNHLAYTPQAYQHYVQQHLLTPLGIHDMLIGSTNKSLPNEVHYYTNNPNQQLPYGNTQVLQKTYAFGGWLASPIDLVKLINGLPKLLNQQQLNFISTKPSHIFYKLKKTTIPYYYSSGFWLYPQKTGLAWVGHGGFTGTRAIVIKRPDKTIIALIFNKRPRPSTPALDNIRSQLLKVKI